MTEYSDLLSIMYGIQSLKKYVGLSCILASIIFLIRQIHLQRSLF